MSDISSKISFQGRRPVFRTGRFWFILMAGILGLASWGWAGPQAGGRLTLGLEIDSWGFDALKARRQWGAGLISSHLVMERLFELGPDRELIPVLGLSAEPSADRKTWTVSLRKGVQFHDGTPFNADAVLSHWQRLLDPGNRYHDRFILTPIESVEKAGVYEVVFRLKHAWLPFIDTLTGEMGLTALIPSPKAVEQDRQNRAPVGTGPFVFKEWKTGDRIVLVKNEHYWRPGRPFLDEVVLKIIPDQETKYAALVSGQVDMILTDRPQHVKKLLADPRFQSLKCRTGIIFFALNTAKPPLNRVQVRQGLACAWDQDKYIQASFKGIFEPAHDVLCGDHDCGNLGYKKHDPDQARALLEAGDAPITLEYFHTATLRGRETGAIAQQIFRQAGVDLKPVPMDVVAIFRQIKAHDFNLASWILHRSSDMGPTLYATFHSQGPWNVTGFSNQEVDRLLEEQRLSQDPAQRKEILCRVARIVNEKVPLIFLYQNGFFLFSRTRVQGLSEPAYNLLRLSGAWLEP